MPQEKYNSKWPDEMDPLQIELKCIKYGGKWVAKDGRVCGAGMFEHLMAARALVWPDRYRHRWTELLYNEFIRNDVTIMMGCASCVSGDTRLLNPITGQNAPIAELCERGIRPLVMTLDGAELANVPFLKGYAELFEVTLSSGRKFKATSEHRVLTDIGFLKVGALSCGRRLLAYSECRQASSSGNGPSIPLSDAARWWKTTPDFQSDCPSDCHFDGEPLPRRKGNDQGTSPLPSGAHKRSRYASRAWGDPTLECGHSPDYPQLFPPSSCNDRGPSCKKENAAKPQLVSSNPLPGYPLSPQLDQSLSDLRHSLPCAKPDPIEARNETVHDLRPCAGLWVQREHITSIESVGFDFYYDLEVPKAHHYFAEGAIHHNSQKTSHASEYVLLNYWARPDQTLVILSTITMDKLDTGVWGEVKMLWERGNRKFPYLAGHILENKRALVTDNLGGGDARDIRRGIVSKACYVGTQWVGLGVLCFPEGQMVDTPSGPVAIEQLRPGSAVIGAAGPSQVTATANHIAPSLARIHFRDGRTVDCTPEHRFFTDKGWVSAIDMDPNTYVFSPCETLRILRAPNGKARFPVLLQREMLGESTDPNLSGVSDQVSAKGQSQPDLFKALHDEIEDERPGVRAENPSQDKHAAACRENLSLVQSSSTGIAQAAPALCLAQTHGQAPQLQGLRTRGGNGHDGCRTDNLSAIPNGSVRPSNCHGQERQTRRGALLPPRLHLAENQTCSGGGWKLSPKSQTKGERQAPHAILSGAWVDCVEILKPSGDPRYNRSQKGYRVYNLQVARHPSFGLNGFVAHNCGIKQEYIFYLADELQFMAPSFIGSWPNLFSNGNVKILGSGNPKHDPDDQLGIAAEPKDGWGAQGEPKKTEVWDTQFLNGRCVNLVGTDSPNLDVAEGLREPFPKLIGRKFIKRIAHDWGEESPEYYSQCKGVMRVDMAENRVITRQLCRQHKAHDMPTWVGGERTKVYGLDPSYGGGDLCVATVGQFGPSEGGKVLLHLVAWRVIPIRLVRDMSPEDQVAEGVAEDLAHYGIPPENCFYDPYGKGTLGFAFARKFGSNSPIPVDSGGRPTDRPVRDDLFVYDEDKGTRRLKKCSEHYSKFVTEAWFSVRYCIESEQFRAMPQEVMLEGCARKYGMVAGNKYEVESKDDLKARVKSSPNKFDSCAIMVEGARQRGFRIARLGMEIDGGPGAEEWFDKDAQDYQEMIASKLLIRR